MSELTVVAYLPAQHAVHCARRDPDSGPCDCGAKPVPLVRLSDALVPAQPAPSTEQDRNILAVALLRFEQDERGTVTDRERARQLRMALREPAPGQGQAVDQERDGNLRRVWNTLMFFASESSYTLGERTGGVLQGCPRKPPPTPDELAGYAQNALAALCRYLGREPDEWMLAASPSPQPAQEDRIAELENEVAHVRQWYGSRLEILSAWAREHLTGEPQTTFFNIVANAQPHVSEEPEWFRAVIRKLASKAEQPAQEGVTDAQRQGGRE